MSKSSCSTCAHTMKAPLAYPCCSCSNNAYQREESRKNLASKYEYAFAGTAHKSQKKGLQPILQGDSADRKATPIFSGFLAYFPRAAAAVARLSKAGNDKHNPGGPLHWSKHKSPDHADCIVRHQIDAGTEDPEDNHPHSAKVAWRALAQLEIELASQERGMTIPEYLKWYEDHYNAGTLPHGA